MSSMVADNCISDPEVQSFREDRTTAVVLVVFTLAIIGAELSLFVAIDFSEFLVEADFPILCVGIVELVMALALPFAFGLAAIEQIYSRLILSPERITYQRFWSQRTIPVWDVTAVNYLIEEGKEHSKAVIQVSNEQEMIEISVRQFEDQDEDKIVCWVREHFDPCLQHDWEVFENGRLKLREQLQLDRRGVFWVITMGFGSLAIFFWFCFPPAFILFFPIVLLVCWLAWKKRIFADQDDSGEFEPTA